MRFLLSLLALLTLVPLAQASGEPTRVFVFAGQSNMVGADSKASDVDRFPPFRGLGEAQEDVLFWHVIGRERKTRSDGWVALAPINNMVGPELSFARSVRDATGAPVAIIKVATGGTHLGGDWNPDDPQGFKLYPLLIETVRQALGELHKKRVEHRLEAFVWHQGENDMFEESYLPAYGRNLTRFMECVRRDLGAPELPFFVGELCTKTIWGMDLRPRMAQIADGQREATSADPLATYVPTSHVGVEIGHPVGLHYHYGTLGQLEHGENHARAYLRSVGLGAEPRPSLKRWPHKASRSVALHVLAGHRNMEGERAFVADLEELRGGKRLAKASQKVPFRFSLGGGVHVSNGWEPLGPAGLYGTFGPELSFASALSRASREPFAVAKFTHSGSQIIDWTPEGSEVDVRDLYPSFIAFIRESVQDLESRGHQVHLATITYHLGENDMSFGPYRRAAPERVMSFVRQSREDLGLPELRWILTQQRPTSTEGLDKIDPVGALSKLCAADPFTAHVFLEDAPEEEERLVMRAESVVWLGERIAEAVVGRR